MDNASKRRKGKSKPKEKASKVPKPPTPAKPVLPPLNPANQLKLSLNKPSKDGKFTFGPTSTNALLHSLHSHHIKFYPTEEDEDSGSDDGEDDYDDEDDNNKQTTTAATTNLTYRNPLVVGNRASIFANKHEPNSSSGNQPKSHSSMDMIYNLIRNTNSQYTHYLVDKPVVKQDITILNPLHKMDNTNNTTTTKPEVETDIIPSNSNTMDAYKQYKAAVVQPSSLSINIRNNHVESSSIISEESENYSDKESYYTENPMFDFENTNDNTFSRIDFAPLFVQNFPNHNMQLEFEEESESESDTDSDSSSITSQNEQPDNHVPPIISEDSVPIESTEIPQANNNNNDLYINPEENEYPGDNILVEDIENNYDNNSYIIDYDGTIIDIADNLYSNQRGETEPIEEIDYEEPIPDEEQVDTLPSRSETITNDETAMSEDK